MAAEAGFHNGVAAANVPSENAAAVGLAEKVDDLGVACARGEHQGCLVVIVERGTWVFVAGFEEDLTDITMSERCREVKVRVGEVRASWVRVMEEGRMGFQDSAEESSIVGVDCASNTN